MNRVAGLIFIFAFSASVVADEPYEMADSVFNTHVASEHINCFRDLVDIQRYLVLELGEKLDEYRRIQKCLMPDSSLGCSGKEREQAINEMKLLEEHRQNQSAIETTFVMGGFELRTNAIGLGTNQQGDLTLTSGSLSNGMGQRIAGLSEEEQAQHWQSHRSKLEEYINKTWWPRNREKFANWHNCLETKADRLAMQEDKMEYGSVIERPKDKHLLFPKFRTRQTCSSLSDISCRSTQKSCDALFKFWSTAPYGEDFSREIRRSSAVKDQQLKAGLPPWLYNVSGQVAGKSRDEKLKMAYAAYDKLIFQTTKLRNWIGKLRDYQLGAVAQLLPRNIFSQQCQATFSRGGVKSLFCEDHAVKFTGSRTVDECLAGFFMPTNAAISLFKDLRNDEAFLIGLKNREEWQKERDENQQAMARSTAYSLPATVATGGVAHVAGKAIAPLAKDVAENIRLIKYKRLVPDIVGNNPEFQKVLLFLESRGVSSKEIQDVLKDVKNYCH